MKSAAALITLVVLAALIHLDEAKPERYNSFYKRAADAGKFLQSFVFT